MSHGREGRLAELTTLFRWPHTLLENLERTLGLATLRQSLLCATDTTVSTHFSGIGTVEQGLACLRAAGADLGITIHAQGVSSCDNNSFCVDVLNVVTDGCVFGDILERTTLRPEDFKQLPTEEARVKAMMSSRVRRLAWCQKHNKRCATPRSTVDMAGSPCQAHSRIGNRRGTLADNFQCLLAWAKIHIHSATPLLLHENVPGFPEELMVRIFGLHYDCTRLQVSTAAAGFGHQLRRHRVYDVLVHKRFATTMYPIDELYTTITRNFVELTERSQHACFMIALPAEVGMEHRAKVEFRKTGSTTAADQMYTDNQQNNLARYTAMFTERYGLEESRHAFYHLNDNPQQRCVWSGTGRCLPTIRRAMGPVHSAQFNRPVTTREALTAMGFIVYDDLAESTGLPKLMQDVHLDGRASRAATGNAMHLPNSLIVLATALSAVRAVRPAELAFHEHVASAVQMHIAERAFHKHVAALRKRPAAAIELGH